MKEQEKPTQSKQKTILNTSHLERLDSKLKIQWNKNKKVQSTYCPYSQQVLTKIKMAYQAIQFKWINKQKEILLDLSRRKFLETFCKLKTTLINLTIIPQEIVLIQKFKLQAVRAPHQQVGTKILQEWLILVLICNKRFKKLSKLDL